MRTWSLLWLCLAVPAMAAENIYPDPGFEQTGTVGEAHSGKAAGHLTVGEKNHWVTIGGALTVEPFATYQVTGWAKAKYAEGSAQALYVYQWDSYVWCWGHSQQIPKDGDWQQYSITFCVPQDAVYFHPLAFLDAAHGEAWVDDVTIERIKSPAETMAALAAKADPQGDDARLLVRWYVKQGQLDRAEALLDGKSDAHVKADIACVLGLNSKEPAYRAKMLAAMLANGASGYNDGPRRIAQVSEGLDREPVTKLLVDQLVAHPNDKGAATAVSGWLRQGEVLGNQLGAMAGAIQRLEESRAAYQQLLQRLPAGSAGRAVLEETAAALDERLAQGRLAMAERGHCRLTIGGKLVTADTYVIVQPIKPTPSEQTAALDLQGHLEKITGEALPIVDLSGTAGKSYLVVGQSPLVEALGVKVDYGQLGLEGLRIATVDHNLVLTGNQRGVLYAVYVFLEEHLGCRWFTADCSTWPTSGKIEVGDLDLTQIPLLEQRATDYPNSRPPEFAVRNRLNGPQVHADAAWGGKITYHGFVHTFNSLVPPEKYFATHPEYFSEINGKRIVDRSQICLTNPGALQVAIGTVRQWLQDDPSVNIISVSQNDWHNPCQCAKCQALVDEEGSQSGPLLHFVNAIADDIAKDYPQVIIDTLAYQYTRKPPLHVKPLPNVAVRLCSIECEFNRPLATSPTNASFVDDIKGWNQICNRLHIWDYVINYHHCIAPFPNLNVLRPNIQFFIKNGVKSIYEEADYFTKGGELAELRTYLMAKLLWNPNYDVNQATREFVSAYYGAAAPWIAKYLDDIHRLAVSDPDYHMRIYVGVNSPFQTPDALARYAGWFDQAEAAVQADPTLLHRVRVARLPILYTKIAQRSSPAYQLTDEALVPVESTNYGSDVKRFAEIARAEGVTRVSEGRDWGYLDVWLERVGDGAKQMPLVKLQGGGLTALVCPEFGGRIVSLKRGAQELLQVYPLPGGIDPSTGGYKEFSETGYQSPGWREPYQVVSQAANKVTVRSGVLSNGLRFERTYELLSDRPELQVKSLLSNASKASKDARIRVHACFRLNDAATASLRHGNDVTSLADGATKEVELYLRGKQSPPGEWTIVDPAGQVTITSRFDPHQVDVCYFNWNGPDHRANPELWTPEYEVEPGSSIELEHSYVVGEP